MSIEREVTEAEWRMIQAQRTAQEVIAGDPLVLYDWIGMANEVVSLRQQLRGAVGDRDEMAALLTEAVRSDYGTPGWRARAITTGCLTATVYGGQ